MQAAGPVRVAVAVEQQGTVMTTVRQEASSAGCLQPPTPYPLKEQRVPILTIHPDDPIDLQMHTTYSDGQWTPEHLFDHLAAAGFRVVAVTDHDRVDGIPVMVAAGTARGIHVIPAVEVTTAWDGRPVDVLCFAEAFAENALAELVRSTERDQLENTRDVHRELARRGYAFPRQAEVLRAQGGEPMRPIDNATLLHAHGHTPTLTAALDVIRAAGFRSIAADLGAAVAAAHASGAVALIAHPGRREAGFTLFDLPLLDALRAQVPLDGIEVRYPLHTPQQVDAYDRYARAHGWLQSAGSDSHGPHQRLPIPYPARVARELLARCGVEVTV
jgi:predicted metal-dependent phosphoesterase TrpH